MRVFALPLLAACFLGCAAGHEVRPPLASWQWIEEGRLIASPAPDRTVGGAETWWRSLAEAAGGRPLAVLNLQEAPDPEAPAGLSVEALDVPIRDFGVPTDAEASRALEFLASRLAAGRVVVVHCAAGCGRTGTLIALYLKHSQGISGDEAIRRVRQIRPCAVETPGQEAFVREH